MTQNEGLNKAVEVLEELLLEADKDAYGSGSAYSPEAAFADAVRKCLLTVSGIRDAQRVQDTPEYHTPGSDF